jgi:ribosome-associated translation inhibitor RaiA
MDTAESLIELVNKELSLELPVKISVSRLTEQLAAYINHLINTDFEKLVYYLYRIDVNETKMKQLLKSQNDNTGDIIADLMIERQLQKLKSRRENSQRDNVFDEDEKW